METIQMSLFKDENKKDKTGLKTVISASRRTDIPAFFYPWLQETLKGKSVLLSNPRFVSKTYTVDLTPENVHSIVLWSKSFANVLKDPGYLQDYNLYFQYTINNYSKILEPNVPEYKDTMSILEGLLKKYIPQQFNIRFDPVIISAGGEVDVHEEPWKARLEVYENLCKDIKALGMERCRVTTSYLYMYGHVKSSLEKSGAGLIDLKEQEKICFFRQMAEISEKWGVNLYSCSDPLLENIKGIKKGHCIDGALLEALFGGRVKKSKDSGQRKTCGCSSSKDIGTYAGSRDGMRCLHGCRYCYAVNSYAKAHED